MGSQSSKWLKDVDLHKEVDFATAQRIWNNYDVNHDGFLDKEETKKFIKEWCSYHEIKDVDTEFHKFWATFELREELKISKEDLLGELPPGLTGIPSAVSLSPHSSPRLSGSARPSSSSPRLSSSVHFASASRRLSSTAHSPSAIKAEDQLLTALTGAVDATRTRVKTDKSFRSTLASQLVRFTDKVNDADRNGCSLLDIQKGIFCLLQGAAYRVYGTDYALDPATEKPDRSLPYTWKNFVMFVKATMELYKSMNILDEACHKELDALSNMVAEQEQKIRQTVKEWTKEKQAEWEQTEEELYAKQKLIKEAELKRQEEEKKLEEVKKEDAAMSRAAQNKRNMYSEGFGPETVHALQPMLNLQHRFPVLLDGAEDESLQGCVNEMSFFYEKFIPQLLCVCSIQSASDLVSAPTEQDLDSWLNTQKQNNVFVYYGKDLVDGWSKCDYVRKLSLSRAWRLLVFYLNGIQKQRERTDAGEDWRKDSRADGDLSMYCAFVDVYLNKSYVQAWAMRLSFPYLLGPNTWTWHHAAAERAVQLAAIPRTSKHASIVVENFKAYIESFVNMYPCPYCRSHLNHSVIRGGERTMYPVEYLFVGWEPSADNLEGKLEPAQKISYVTDARSLSLFVWKLHNAVNSSIAREEEWYHAEVESVYTSRYWPNLDAELYRAQNASGVASAHRLLMIVDLLKTAKELAALREVILSLATDGYPKASELMKKVKSLIEKLDNRILASGFLRDTYGYQPGLSDPEPDPFQSRLAGDTVRHEDFTLS